LEILGYGGSTAHTFLFYITYILWFFSRALLPSYNLYILWVYTIPTVSLSSIQCIVCVLPAILCGHIISLFCIGCFLFIMTPDVLARWREPTKSMGSVATLHQTDTPRSSSSNSPKAAMSKSSFGYGTLDNT
jgi:hypothetical protein